MTNSTVFTNSLGQAELLPKAVAFPEGVHNVDILKIGHSRVIMPQGQRWDDLFQNGPRASEDFMVEREQPPAEELGRMGGAKRYPSIKKTENE